MIKFKFKFIYTILLVLAIALVLMSSFMILFFPEFQTTTYNIYIYGYEALLNHRVAVFDEYIAFYEQPYPIYQLIIHFVISGFLVLFIIFHLLDLYKDYFWLTDDTCLIKKTFLFETVGVMVMVIIDAIQLVLTIVKGERGTAGTGLGTIFCIAMMIASLVIVAITNLLLFKFFKKEREKIYLAGKNE